MVVIYGLRRLARKNYIYIGSTINPVESRTRRHIQDSRKKRHTNKQLASIIRDSHNMIVADVLFVCEVKDRANKEHEYIMKFWGLGHKLCNITNPKNPREKLSYLKKRKKT